MHTDRRFCLIPGKVKSKTDGDIHYIGVAALARLYHLRNGQYVVHDAKTPDRPCPYIHLEPRSDGNYFDANERYPRG